MDTILTLDGVEYNIAVPLKGSKMERKQVDSAKAGRTLTGVMVRDVVGTGIVIEIIVSGNGTDPDVFEALSEVLNSNKPSFRLKWFEYKGGEEEIEMYCEGTTSQTIGFSSDGKVRHSNMTVRFISILLV